MDFPYDRIVFTYNMSEIEVLFPRVRAEVLRLLFVGDERAMHLRELARKAGVAVRTMQQEVAKLERAGLIESTRDGNRLVLRANRS